uniref:Retinal protein n=1 Tax=Pithovirus LCPAC202 TaxID=2506592 RepID=A0A481Z5T1_9VIRU|nr:MAG: retinal protein [Pithovirus LCPAC202]
MTSQVSPKARSIDEIITQSVGRRKSRNSKRRPSSRKQNKRKSEPNRSHSSKEQKNIHTLKPSNHREPSISNLRPLSPRDNTPITISGKVIPRENFGDISNFKHLPAKLQIVSKPSVPPIISEVTLPKINPKTSPPKTNSKNTPAETNSKNTPTETNPKTSSDKTNSKNTTAETNPKTSSDKTNPKTTPAETNSKNTSSKTNLKIESAEINSEITPSSPKFTSIPPIEDRKKTPPPVFINIDDQEKPEEQYPGSPRQNGSTILNSIINKEEVISSQAVDLNQSSSEFILNRVISPRNILSPTYEMPPSPIISNILPLHNKTPNYRIGKNTKNKKSKSSIRPSKKKHQQTNSKTQLSRRAKEPVFTDPTGSLPQIGLVKSPDLRFSGRRELSNRYQESDDLVICPAPPPVIASHQSIIIPEEPTVTHRNHRSSRNNSNVSLIKQKDNILDQVKRDIYSPYLGSPLIGYSQQSQNNYYSQNTPYHQQESPYREQYSQNAPHYRQNTPYHWKESHREKHHRQNTPYHLQENRRGEQYPQNTPYSLLEPYYPPASSRKNFPNNRKHVYETGYHQQDTTSSHPIYFSPPIQYPQQSANYPPTISQNINEIQYIPPNSGSNPRFIPMNNEIITPSPVFMPIMSPEIEEKVPTQWENQPPIFIPFSPEHPKTIPPNLHSQNVYLAGEEPNITENQIRQNNVSSNPYSTFPPTLMATSPNILKSLQESPVYSPQQSTYIKINEKSPENIPSPKSPDHILIGQEDESINSPVTEDINSKEKNSPSIRRSRVSRTKSNKERTSSNNEQTFSEDEISPRETSLSPRNSRKKHTTDEKWRGKTLDIKPPIYGKIPEYDQMSPIDQARYRGQFNVLFGMLRERYPHYNIPHFADDESLYVMHGYYESYHFHFSIRDTVDKWKIGLVCIWFGIELLFTKGLGLNLGGYGVNQVSMMPTYEKLLYEFVEKGRGNIGAGLSPEVKILLLTVVSAVVFLIIKYISDWMGPMAGNFLQNLINNLISGGQNQASVTHVANTINNNLPQAPPAANVNTSNPGSIPQIPSFLGGLNIQNLVQTFGGLFSGGAGGGNSTGTANPAPRRRARRRPLYDS